MHTFWESPGGLAELMLLDLTVAVWLENLLCAETLKLYCQLDSSTDTN